MASLCLCSAFLRVLCVSTLKFRAPTLRLRHSSFVMIAEKPRLHYWWERS